MDYIFVKTPITSFLDFLGPTDSTGLFFRNWASSLTLLYGYLTSCKKIREKLRINFDILLCKWTDGRTNERMERRTDPNSEYTFASGCPKTYLQAKICQQNWWNNPKQTLRIMCNALIDILKKYKQGEFSSNNYGTGKSLWRLTSLHVSQKVYSCRCTFLFEIFLEF